ncbi:CocE/NonD family hydrolase [Streptomyces sp. NPDC097619]|uniref:alpha/beta hydrolase family protein n=1 Tax=Streptomyces sp. NPDC097619 TaxID=3157228 RepID=UPI00331EE7D4
MVLGTLVVAAALGGVVLVRNTYALTEQRVRIPAPDASLDAVLALPEGAGDVAGGGTVGPGGGRPLGLVVFVHGDGPVDSTHESYYRPLWESFARAGYASLSWHKPGVAGAPGDWLRQSMDDRAAETAAAVAWARTRPGIDPDRIGLWGISQAGWVLPKVAARTTGVRFVIAVSPAVNWLRQGRYNLLAELRDRGARPEEVRAALAGREHRLDLLRRGLPYDGTDITPDRWGFIVRNHRADATADLRAMPRRLPVLLVLGGHDLHVDVAETERVYRRELDPGALRVAFFPEATHGMVPRAVEESGLRLTLTALFDPRSLYTPGVLRTQTEFLPGRAAAGAGAR